MCRICSTFARKIGTSMAKIVVFTGAGVSAESGLGTFRDSDGLWEHYRVEDVCTHEAWLRNPELCVKFYNDRRRDTLAAQPNAAHIAIAKLQEVFPDTQIITQNIDDLHERAGAKNVVHLHGGMGATLRRPPSQRIAAETLHRLLRRRSALFRGSLPDCRYRRHHDRGGHKPECLSRCFAAPLHAPGYSYLFCGSGPAGVRRMGRQDHTYPQKSNGRRARVGGKTDSYVIFELRKKTYKTPLNAFALRATRTYLLKPTCEQAPRWLLSSKPATLTRKSLQRT